jgi:hypothetical protein
MASFGGAFGRPGELHVAETVEGELRAELFSAFATEDEFIRDFGRAHVVDVDGAIGVDDLGKAQADTGACRALHADAFDAGEVLAEVIDKDARLGLGHGLFGVKVRSTRMDGKSWASIFVGLGSMDSTGLHPAPAKLAVSQPGCLRRASWLSPS